MKLSHNKKRNTIFIYEMLVKQLSKASMYNIVEKKQQILSILKESFSKGMPLKQELDIYKSFEEIDGLRAPTVEKMILESKNRFANLDRKKIFDEQTKIISKINKTLGTEVWNTFIREFKKMATINQILSQGLSPKNQVLLEEKFLENFVVTHEEKKPFPNVNNLAVKNFVEKFNEKYSQTLAEEQKELLTHYITSFTDNAVSLKSFLNEEIARLKNTIVESSEHEMFKEDPDMHRKATQIVEKLDTFRKTEINDAVLLTVLRTQELAKELSDGSNN